MVLPARSREYCRGASEWPRIAGGRIHFHRHLVVGAADAPGLTSTSRLKVPNRFLKILRASSLVFLGDLVHRAVEPALRGALLAFPHHRADELLNDVASVDRIQR